MLFTMMVNAERAELWLWRMVEDGCSGLYATMEVPASSVALDPMGHDHDLICRR